MTRIDNLRGSIVAIVTPFQKNGDIDLPAFDRLLEWHVSSGTNGIVVCGTTGETPTLSEEEDAMMISRAVEVINGRLPVIAGTGSNSTRDCIKYSKMAQSLGADALLVVAPYYNKPTREGLYRHFSAVAGEVTIPVILYNVPGRTGSCISWELALKLARDHANVIAIKEAGGNIEVFTNLIANRPEGFKVYSGDDSISIFTNLAGGDGCISVVANVIPDVFSQMMKASLNGDVVQTRSLFFKYKKLMELMFVESNPIPVKTSMAMMGLVNEVFRLPLCQMEATNRLQVKEELEKLALI